MVANDSKKNTCYLFRTHLIFEEMSVHKHAVLVGPGPHIVLDHLFVDAKVSVGVKVVVLRGQLIRL